MGSMPSSSARIQSAPAGIFSMRSPTPVAVHRCGAAARVGRSTTRPCGARQLRVVLKPSTEMEAPKAA